MVVAYKDLAEKAKEFIIVEVYDSFWLWCLSLEMIQSIRELDLVNAQFEC